MIAGGFEVIAGLDYEAEAAITYMVNCGTYPMDIHYIEPEDKDRLNKAVEKLYRPYVKNGRVIPGKEPKAARWQTTGSGWIAHTDHPGVGHFFFGDVRKITGKQMLDALGLEQGQVTCICGGPPCQGFSTAGKRDVMDPRNSLVFEFARLVLEIRPMTFVMENVPSILSMTTPEGFPVMDVFCAMIEKGGYGSADAIKKSLLESAGAGAAYKSAGKPMSRAELRKLAQDEDEDDEPAQLALEV